MERTVEYTSPEGERPGACATPGFMPGQRAHGLPQTVEACQRSGHGFQEERPGAFGGNRSPRVAGLNRRHEAGAALFKEQQGSVGLSPVERRRKPPLPLHFARAGGAPVQVLLHALLFFGRQFAVEVKRNQLHSPIATHTKSPNTERIFCVARKRQFLAASSVVPRVSPMFRRRSPW